MYSLEIEDKASARNREIEVAKMHKFDFLFYLTGIIGLGVFCFIVYAIVYLTIPEANKEIWIHLIGISEGVVLSIFGYYFGSSIKRNLN
jgi:CDP-diglyceride synthetase